LCPINLYKVESNRETSHVELVWFSLYAIVAAMVASKLSVLLLPALLLSVAAMSGRMTDAKRMESIFTVTADVEEDVSATKQTDKDTRTPQDVHNDDDQGPLEVFLMAAGKALGEKLQESKLWRAISRWLAVVMKFITTSFGIPPLINPSLNNHGFSGMPLQ